MLLMIFSSFFVLLLPGAASPPPPAPSSSRDSSSPPALLPSFFTPSSPPLSPSFTVILLGRRERKEKDIKSGRGAPQRGGETPGLRGEKFSCRNSSQHGRRCLLLNPLSFAVPTQQPVPRAGGESSARTPPNRPKRRRGSPGGPPAPPGGLRAAFRGEIAEANSGAGSARQAAREAAPGPAERGSAVGPARGSAPSHPSGGSGSSGGAPRPPHRGAEPARPAAGGGSMLLDAAAAASPPPCVCAAGAGTGRGDQDFQLPSAPTPPRPRTSPGPRSARGAPGTAGPTASAGSIARARLSCQQRPGRARGRLVSVCPRSTAAAEGPPHLCAPGVTTPRNPIASTLHSGTAASGSRAALSARGWGFEGHPGGPSPQKVPTALQAVPGAQHPVWAHARGQRRSAPLPTEIQRPLW